MKLTRIFCILALTQNTIAQETQDPFSTSLATLKIQVQAAEQRVNDSASAVRQARQSDAPDQTQLDKLNSQLMIEVRKAFELTQQLQNAQLDDAEAQIAASRKRLESRQRLADKIVAKRVVELLLVSPDAVSPQAAIAAMERYGRARDFKSLVGLLTDDEANRYAGMLIQSVSMTATMMGMAQQSETPLVADSGPYAAMQQSLQKYMKLDPPAEAAAALEELSTKIMSGFFSQLGATIDGKPVEKSELSANELSDLMRKSAGVLTDARGFVVELLQTTASFSGQDKPETGVVEDSEWTFEITSDMAVARRSGSTSNVMNSPEIKLQMIRGEWRISQMGTDDELLKFSSGPSVSVAQNSPPTSMPALQQNRLPPDAAAPSNNPALGNPPEPLYQSVTRSEWQSRFANETEPATRIEAAQALVALAAMDDAEERFERCMTLGTELMESGFGENATHFVFSQSAPNFGMGGPYGQQYCLWVYQPLKDLFAKWFALMNQTDAVLVTIPPQQLAELLIKETNHESLPRAAFAALLMQQDRIVNVLKDDEEARRQIVSELKGANDGSLRFTFLRTQAGIYDHSTDWDSDAGKSFLASFCAAGEKLAAEHITDYDTFALAGSWVDLQKNKAFAPQNIAAQVVLRMLAFSDGTRQQVLLYEDDLKKGYTLNRLGARTAQVGESFRSEWITAVNEYLKTQIEADPTKVSPAVVGTINEFIRTQTPDEKWDTETTAKLLTPLLEKYFIADPANVEGTPSMLDPTIAPDTLLSTILHCGGEIPPSVIDNDTSPFQVSKSAIETAREPNPLGGFGGDVRQFSLPEGIDVLTFLAVADQLAGVHEEQDLKISLFLKVNVGPDDRAQQEYSTIPAQKFLKRIEQKTKTDVLRDVVRKLILPPVEIIRPLKN